MTNRLPKQKKLVSISEAAKILGVSIDTIRRWDKAGVLNSQRPDGKNRYFSQDQLEKHKADQPLPISEAATMLGISPTTLRRLEARQILKPTRNNAGERVYTKGSLQEFQNSNYSIRKRTIRTERTISSESKAPEVKTEGPVQALKPHSSKFDFLAISTALFLLLVTIGVGNIMLIQAGKVQPISAPAVLGIAIAETSPEINTYILLGLTFLLYPLLVLFAYKIFYRRRRNHTNPSLAAPEETTTTPSIGISDIDKRVFLKLIGGAGVFLFLLSIFNKKAEGLFFKSAPGSVSGKIALEDKAGNVIDPAQNQPLDGYNISEIDDDVIAYYGFLSKDGAWYIMRADTDKGSFRYVRDNANFPSNWDNRANLKYTYFSNVF